MGRVGRAAGALVIAALVGACSGAGNGGGDAAAARTGDSASAPAPASTTPAGGGYAQEGTPGAGTGTGNTMLPESTARQDSALRRAGRAATGSGTPAAPQPE